MKNAARPVVLLLVVTFYVCIARAQSLSGIVNTYYSITSINSGVNSVTLTDASGLSAGQRVLLYQAKGAAITTTNSSNYGDLATLNNAGAYEFNTICSINGNEVWLTYALLYPYDPAGMVQLVTVPSSASITVAGTVTGAAWDPTTGTGGIVALESSGAIALNADIDVSSQGLQGGALVNYPTPTYNCAWNVTASDFFYSLPASGDLTGGRKGEGIAAYISGQEYGRGKLSNGGGGGNNANSGGAGGGNYSLGGDGGQRAGEGFFNCHGQYPGIGGAGLSAFGYSAAANRIFFGGGGGSGQENNNVGTPGGNGGGIIFLSAPNIDGGGGRLLASGSRPMNAGNSDPYQAEGDGGGGGGAGGTIILNGGAFSGAITADVSGGAGSNSSNHVNDCTGPGGGGSGGVIWTAGGVFPAVIMPVVNGGANGVVSSGSSKTSCVGSANGATPGAAGFSQPGYTLPFSAVNVCTILANPALQSFSATRRDEDVLLNWTLTSAEEVRDFIIQRSVNGHQFDSLVTVPSPVNVTTFQFADAAAGFDGAIAYRLVLVSYAGKTSYSRIVTVPARPGPDAGSFRVFPNPVTNELTLTVMSMTTENAVITISNGPGQVLRRRAVTLHGGLSSFSILVDGLARGAYFLVLESAGRHIVKPFIKTTSR